MSNSWLALVDECQPAQTVEDAADHLGRRPFEIGVFNPQHEHAAEPAGEEPVEQSCAGSADVKIAGGRGGETDARGCHVGMAGLAWPKPAPAGEGWR